VLLLMWRDSRRWRRLAALSWAAAVKR
jgi:hypothetical protein